MGLCKKCGTWHSSKECPLPVRITCSCGNSFLIPWDATGMVTDITCGKCGNKMSNAVMEEEKEGKSDLPRKETDEVNDWIYEQKMREKE